VHADLKDWPVLRRELMNFRPEITREGHETWNARSGEHDDLVIAVALCAWRLQDGARPYDGLMRFLADQHAREGGGGGGGEHYCVGVDVGQANDPTAICVMSRIDDPSPEDRKGVGQFIPDDKVGAPRLAPA
jgi:hypothetical protein